MSLFFDLHLLEKGESRIFMHSPSFGMLVDRNVFSNCFDPTFLSCFLHAVSSFLKNSKFIQSSCSLCSLALKNCMFVWYAFLSFSALYAYLLQFDFFRSFLHSHCKYYTYEKFLPLSFERIIRFRLIHNFWLLPSLKFENTINILFPPYQAID